MNLYAAGMIVDIVLLFVFIIGVYYLAIAVFSLMTKGGTVPEHRPYRFAAAIPAHNEESVICGIIESIRRCDYPQDMIEIFVAADGCTDRTAELAEKAGARVLVRRTAEFKGNALAELFAYIENSGFEYDCAAVFDADNVLDRNFFNIMGDKIAAGCDAVQGYIDSKNPDSSWIAHAHSVWYWIVNCTMQTGRERLAIGCRLEGTGFVLTRGLLRAVPWRTETMAEDREYTCLLAENDIKVSYAENAVVYDEKPTSFSQSAGQRRRWAEGVSDVQGGHTMKLLKMLKFHTVLGLWYEVTAFLAYNMIFASVCLGIGGVWQSTPGRIAGYLYLAANIVVVILALVKDKKFNAKIILNIFGFILFLLSWLPIGVFGLFGKRGNWYQTGHGEKRI